MSIEVKVLKLLCKVWVIRKVVNLSMKFVCWVWKVICRNTDEKYRKIDEK